MFVRLTPYIGKSLLMASRPHDLTNWLKASKHRPSSRESSKKSSRVSRNHHELTGTMITLTSAQQDALDALQEFAIGKTPHGVATLSGFAGVGRRRSSPSFCSHSATPWVSCGSWSPRRRTRRLPFWREARQSRLRRHDDAGSALGCA